MSDKPHPLPSGGGSYTLAPDGTLKRAAPAAAKPAGKKSAAKTAPAKSTAKKEGA